MRWPTSQVTVMKSATEMVTLIMSEFDMLSRQSTENTEILLINYKFRVGITDKTSFFLSVWPSLHEGLS